MLQACGERAMGPRPGEAAGRASPARRPPAAGSRGDKLVLAPRGDVAGWSCAASGEAGGGGGAAAGEALPGLPDLVAGVWLEWLALDDVLRLRCASRACRRAVGERLRRLDFRPHAFRGPRPDDAAVAAALAALGGGGTLVALAEVDLSGCPAVGDAAVRAVAAACPRLELLNVSRCRRLTDRCLFELRRCPRLDTLIAWSCVQLTREAAAQLERELPLLRPPLMS